MDFTKLVNFALLATFVNPVAGTLILKPRDADVMVNQSTYFNCSTDLSSAIFWYHGGNLVYTVNGILDLYRERFKIDRYAWNGTYIYNLIIHSAQIGDAGEYKCADDEGTGEEYLVQLVVLDGDPICRSNIELGEVIGQNTCNIKPDEVELSCSVTYYGNVPPQLTWEKDGDNRKISEGLSNINSDNHYNYILKLKGDIALDNSSYVCQATRIAHEPRTCITEVINVLYAIGDNSTVNRRVGDDITCHANTTQSCSYQWRWFKNNDVTTESSSAILKPRKPGLHKCEAECYLRNETCNLLVMQALVSESVEYTQAKNTSIVVPVVVVSVVLTLVLIAVLLFVFNWQKRKNENSLQLDLLPKQNIGSASAWSYFYGYLRIVLPDFKTRLTDGTLKNDKKIVSKTVQKMLIIIPESCIGAKSLEVPTKIESTDMSVVIVTNRAGNQQREYKSSVYKLIGHEKDEEYYFVGELATPLLTMYETCTSALCGMTKDQLYVERDSFFSTLRAILSQRGNTNCNDQFKLLKWPDPATKKRNQLDIYNFLLPELRKEIEFQQKVTDENPSLITDDVKSVLLKEHPEPNVLQLELLPKQAMGRSSALGYFYGYLRLVLPDFKKRWIKKMLKNDPNIVPKETVQKIPKETIQKIPKETVQKISKKTVQKMLKKTVQKMLIIMPDSCSCADSLVVPDKIEPTDKSVVIVANRAGNQQRSYKRSLYKLIDHEKHEEYYFAGELATPLQTMYETYTYALCGMTKDELYVERDAFCSTLKAILNHPNNAKCKDQFLLLNWSDLETQKSNQLDSENPNQLDSDKLNQLDSDKLNQLDSDKPNQPDIYNFLLLELRKEIELQQQNRKKFSNIVKYNNATRSLNTERLSTV